MRWVKTSWVIAAVGALVGAALGLFVALVALLNDGPTLNPVQTAVVFRQPPQPGVDAVLHVELFGTWQYTRFATRPEEFEAEVTSLLLAAPAAVVILGTACGWWAGVMVSRRARRHREGGMAVSMTPIPSRFTWPIRAVARGDSL
jgi:hypothetical protein